MRIPTLPTLLIACGVLAAALSGGAHASACSSEQLYAARASARGEIAVSASFGQVRSTDHGKTWSPVDAAKGTRRGGESLETSVHTDSDGVRYTTKLANKRRQIVRSENQGARWSAVDLLYDGKAPLRNAFLLAAHQGTLYFLGAAQAGTDPVRAQGLYRATNRRVEKLLDLGGSHAFRAGALTIGADGSMALVSHDSLWVSIAGATSWRKTEGSAMTARPWMVCHKAAMD